MHHRPTRRMRAPGTPARAVVVAVAAALVGVLSQSFGVVQAAGQAAGDGQSGQPAQAQSAQAQSAETKAAPSKPAAGDKVDAELDRYRTMLDARDPFANPGYLFVDRGQEAWNQPLGPKAVALAAVCDLGLGVGRVDGAYARLPRYFADADRVLDLEGRLLWCMTARQGRDRSEILKTKFSTPEKTSELEDLTAFVASLSNGKPLAAPLEHPREKAARALGEALFYRRQGPMDFACATCHGEPGRRIRLQTLPAFDVARQAQEVMGSWPAYRVSQNTLRTMQHRLYDCFWQMRLPAVDYASDVTIALTSYLAAKGARGIVTAPGIKR